MGKKKDLLIYVWWTMAIALILTAASCSTKKPEGLDHLPEEDQELISLSRTYFGVLPDSALNDDNLLTEERVMLGKMLFHDTRLSKSSFISCNSCHNLTTFGVDNLPTSVGHNWQIGNRNAPTVLNAAFHTTQFWDGRAKDVEEQATPCLF